MNGRGAGSRRVPQSVPMMGRLSQLPFIELRGSRSAQKLLRHTSTLRWR